MPLYASAPAFPPDPVAAGDAPAALLFGRRVFDRRNPERAVKPFPGGQKGGWWAIRSERGAMIDEGRDPPEDSTAAEPAISEPVTLGLAEAVAADPDTRARAGVLIEEQIKLAAMQRQHLHTQHIRDRFLVAFDLALAVAGVIVLCLAAALFWDAWTSRSVIIDAFDVPASFAAQGLSGKVMASELLDRLKAFQDATRTNQEKRAVEDAWSNRIELQIPEAGISIDEIENLLHRWLARDEHITGSVVED